MLSSSRRYAAMNFTRSSIGHVSSQGIRRAWCHPCLGRHLPPLRQRRHRSRGRSSPMSQRSSHPLRTASHRCPAACSPISRLRSHHPAGLRSPIPRRCCHSCLRSERSSLAGWAPSAASSPGGLKSARNRLRVALKWPSNWPGNTPKNTLPGRAHFRAISRARARADSRLHLSRILSACAIAHPILGAALGAPPSFPLTPSQP